MLKAYALLSEDASTTTAVMPALQTSHSTVIVCAVVLCPSLEGVSAKAPTQ